MQTPVSRSSSPQPSISISPTRLLGHRSHQPFNVSAFHPYTLFEIRLENDFVFLRGAADESAAQLLKGFLVLCLQSPLSVEDVHLELVGTLRHSWTDIGVLGSKINILHHQWTSFIGANGTNKTLSAGNYEWPFEYLLAGDAAESIEGIPEVYLTYTLKASIIRSKFARDLHARKQLRIIRTLSTNSLEFMYAMTIENVWLNKLDYSISIPSKAAVFGGSVQLKMRFTPLVKGLEIKNITATLLEIRECHVPNLTFPHDKKHRTERIVSTWEFTVSTEEDWQNTIEETSQEGWVLTRMLDLPEKLGECIQDLDIHGIKVRHKIKVFVPLINADGHCSELAVALPVYIFISPNMPLDKQGKLVRQSPRESTIETENEVLPGYGDHILDQLYEDSDNCENVGPQLQTSSSADLRYGVDSLHSHIAHTDQTATATASQPRTSVGDSSHSPPDPIDLGSNTFEELSRIPTYRTAVRTPLQTHLHFGNVLLPDYQTAAGSPNHNRGPPRGSTP
ncbi:arrestin domain-containing protein [Ilyonectria robusta]|uniref:arrestin domain-containing protein n=1 Tax=Ilyonectria robusta TaxID=1079257 RepID=UPI001E8CDCDD|nr:arrestin domain-containing protein [Ilyonectria robusta]KAH8734181.1 arrestin domain-containing protein [Ilyonectria robusta]